MPGLFGIISVRPIGKNDSSRLEADFSRMAARLDHLPGQEIHRWSDLDAGIFLGRIGLPFMNRTPWPASSDAAESPRLLFSSGIVHELPRLDRAVDHAFFLELSGFYSTVCLTQKPAAAFLAVDRRASIPIFYAQLADLLVFAPELKALLAFDEIRKEVDPGTFASFLVSGQVLGGQTFFRPVQRLRAGEVLRVADGSVKRESYWRFAPGSAVGSASDEELREEVARQVSAAVARNLGDPAKTVIFLSGGADSRGILGGALEAVGGDGSQIHTVTWGSSEGPPDSDCAIAGQIAREFGLQHRFIRRPTEQYGNAFTRINFLVDGLSDIAAFHPHEFTVMEELRSAGFERVLRGDQVFTPWDFRPRNPDAALAWLNLRRFRDAQGAADFVRPEWHAVLSEASDEAIDNARQEVEHLEPQGWLDCLYYVHRLEGYLNTASYFKQFAVDQRNILLDERILDLTPAIPDRLRISKCLYFKAMARRYPRLWELPIARKDNLENWNDLLGANGPVRSYAVEQFNDRASGIWDYLDRNGLLRVLNGLVPNRSRKRSLVAPLLGGLRSSMRRVYHAMPRRIYSAVQAHRKTRQAFRIRSDKLLFRALTLKHWHDTFVAGTEGRP